MNSADYGPIGLVVIQATSLCNLDCSYCYLPDRQKRHQFDLNQLPLLLQRIYESPFWGPHLSILWHAGEPLTLPCSYYDEATKCLEKATAELQQQGVVIDQHIQTNATLINDQWAACIKRNQIEVGALGRDIVRLTAHVGGQLFQKAVDQHRGAVAFVFEDRKLAVVFVDGTGNRERGPGGFGHVGRKRRVAGDRRGQVVHLVDVLGDAVEIRLRALELLHQDRVARRGADLQARVHGRDGAVVLLRVLDELGPQALQFFVLLGDRILQAGQFFTKLNDFFADKGARRFARRDARRYELGGADRRLAAADDLHLTVAVGSLLLGRLRLLLRLRFVVGGPEEVVSIRAGAERERRADYENS